jgi:hypothetical protein
MVVRILPYLLLNASLTVAQGTRGQAVYQDPNCYSMSAVVEDGHALASDGKGPYAEGPDARVQARGGMSIWSWRYTDNRGNKQDPSATAPKVRSLKFDLDHPVPNSAAQPLGIISDPIGRFHALWKRENNRLFNFTITPIGQSVQSDRIEMWVFTGGHQYVLQMGPWAMGEFSDRKGVAVDGTSQATITRTSDSAWIISAPKGSIARLSLYDDTDKPQDKGLYYFDLTVKANKIPGASCLDIR